MFTRCSFDKKENKLNYYSGKDCIEKLCTKLKERAMKIINSEKKEIIPLKKKISYIKSKRHAIYAKKCFVWIKMMKTKERLKTTVIIQENLEELLIVNAT